jgi:hypothetical protein
MKHQTMLVNENRLNLADQRARQYLARQMENFFLGTGAETARRVCATQLLKPIPCSAREGSDICLSLVRVGFSV